MYVPYMAQPSHLFKPEQVNWYRPANKLRATEKYPCNFYIVKPFISWRISVWNQQHNEVQQYQTMQAQFRKVARSQYHISVILADWLVREETSAEADNKHNELDCVNSAPYDYFDFIIFIFISCCVPFSSFMPILVTEEQSRVTNNHLLSARISGRILI